MHTDRVSGRESQYLLKMKSKVHPSIYHTIKIDLHCYENMPNEKTIQNLKKLDQTMKKDKNNEKN